MGLAAINVILAVSLGIVNGFAGQFSLGHGGFMAVGGYAAAALTLHGLSSPWGFPLAVMAGGVAAALAGIAVGLPSLRLRGDYLAIVTLGFGEIIRVVIENTPFLGGATGLTGIAPRTTIFWLAVAVLLVIVTAVRLRESTHGRALVAIREDETAAEAMGVDTTGYKVRAFALAAFWAGIAGGLLGHYLQILSPKDFTFVRSIEIVTMIVLGGLGSVPGAVVGAVALTVLPEALRGLQGWTGNVDLRMVVYSALLVSMMLLRPQGLWRAGNR
jgi:branched-chain amino acid transport system permease protein